MGNFEVKVKIEIKPTENGIFRSIIENTGLNIDNIEQGLLNTVYPAMREAMP
jgi:hypothetical protein